MRKPDGTYRTYDEMIAENIPVFYEGYTQACVQNADGSIEVCSGNDKDTGLGKPLVSIYAWSQPWPVSVNMETGKAHCEKFVLVGDVGVINNYLVVDGCTAA